MPLVDITTLQHTRLLQPEPQHHLILQLHHIDTVPLMPAVSPVMRGATATTAVQ